MSLFKKKLYNSYKSGKKVIINNKRLNITIKVIIYIIIL